MPPRKEQVVVGAVIEGFDDPEPLPEPKPQEFAPAGKLGDDQALKDFETHTKAKRKRTPLGIAPSTPLDVPLPEGLVRVQITRMGDDKVYTGKADPTSHADKFPRHRMGEVVILPVDVAEAQEKLGHAVRLGKDGRPIFE